MVKQSVNFAPTLRQLLDERYRNRRREFAGAIHVSESALSQYVRGKATPSLPILVAIAQELNVSLDFLVFGVELDPPPPDYGNLVSHLEASLAQVQARSAGLRDFVGRIGSMLATRIQATAEEAFKDGVASGGWINSRELRILESFSRHTRIATADFDLDVMLVKSSSDSGGGPADLDNVEALPAPFTSVIAQNIKNGFSYSYVIPEGAEWRRKARKLRQVIFDLSGVGYATIDRHLTFNETSRALVPGYVIYSVDKKDMQDNSFPLVDRIQEYVEEKSGLIALVDVSNRQSEVYAFVDQRFYARLFREYEEIMRMSSRLVFD